MDVLKVSPIGIGERYGRKLQFALGDRVSPVGCVADCRIRGHAHLAGACSIAVRDLCLHQAQLPFGDFVSPLRRGNPPVPRVRIILGNAAACGDQPAQLIRGENIHWLSGLPPPITCLGVVLGHALARRVHQADVVSRDGLTLLGGLQPPAKCLLLVARYTLPVVVQPPELQLRLGVIRFRTRLDFRDCRGTGRGSSGPVCLAW